MQLSVNYKRVVVKAGSSIFCHGNNFDAVALEKLVSQITLLLDEGVEIILVSSGAVASGMAILKKSLRPVKMADLQACASIGQGALMQKYINAFSVHNKHCAQLLLTWDDFNDRKRYLNAKNTLFSLLNHKALPVINENDTVSTEEIKFGDNDNLSALVAILVKADLLIILSDVDGLLDLGGLRVPIVSKINAEIKKMACSTKKQNCRGGMITKLEAAQKASNAGIPCIIANGKAENILERIIVDKEGLGTLFLPVPAARLRGKKSWIAYSSKPVGKIFVDDGAKDALIKRNKSLLCVGIFKVEGKFKPGDTVSILDSQGKEFARGAVSCSAEGLNLVKGKRHPVEIVHRDNLALI